LTKADSLKKTETAAGKSGREPKDAIRYKRQELYRETFGYFERKAYRILDLAKYEPREAKEMVKETHRELKGVQMSRDQFRTVYDLLDKAWEKANWYLKKKYEDKHKEWTQRMQSHIERWTSLLEKPVLARERKSHS